MFLMKRGGRGWGWLVKKNKRLASGEQDDCPRYGRAGREGVVGEEATFSTNSWTVLFFCFLHSLWCPMEIVEVPIVLPNICCCPLCVAIYFGLSLKEANNCFYTKEEYKKNSQLHKVYPSRFYQHSKLYVCHKSNFDWLTRSTLISRAYFFRHKKLVCFIN